MDGSKRQRNIERHHLDFDDVYDLDWDLPRLVVTGLLRGDLVTVIISPLGTEAYSIVSMRRASRRERHEYESR